MASNGPESNQPKGGLWARLFGHQTEASDPSPPKEELQQVWQDLPSEAPAPDSAAPAEHAPPSTPPDLTLPEKEAEPVATVEPVEEVVAVEEVFSVPAVPPGSEGVPAPEEIPLAVAAAVAVAQLEALPAELCPACATPRKGAQTYCDDCGWMFGPSAPASRSASAAGAPAAAAAVPMASAAASAPPVKVKDRYQLGELLVERAGVSRYRGFDLEGGQRVPVTILRAALPEMAEPLEVEELPQATMEPDDLLPSFEDPIPVATVGAAGLAWPSLAWERNLLEGGHPALPRVLDAFVEDNFDYLIEETPQGRSIWDPWDDPDTNGEMRYGWLRQIAEGMDHLHQGGAILEGLQPDSLIVNDAGQAMLTDLSGLLPVPVPPGTPIRDNLYTAPELVLSPDQADARADIYTFGALLYSLEYLHHGLEEKDFERPFAPRLITDRYPDAHPGFIRLVNKTFCRDVNTRFPTDEAGKEDPTGFRELIRTLEVCGRTFDRVRLDIAAWTTTGMVRTGNEDAFAFLHAVEGRQDDLAEYAVLLLADGMGGYEAGEVAAAMAIAAMRKNLLEQPLFSALAGKEPPDAEQFSLESCKKLLLGALKYANREVYTAARIPGKGRRGMGCTAEAVYVDAHHVVVGHVGDSRTYHLHAGQLIQLTRDQTLVNRLVELGTLTEEEAEDHPRKNELQQAIGGQPDVEPGLYHGKLKRGDWVLVCSDGLTNHVPAKDLQMMLMREASGSAEDAARRLLNLVNLRGATDNATIVVIRAV